MYIKIDDQDVDDGPSYVEVSGMGRNEDGEWFLFVEGELIPRWVGQVTNDDGVTMTFSGLDYPLWRV